MVQGQWAFSMVWVRVSGYLVRGQDQWVFSIVFRFDSMQYVGQGQWYLVWYGSGLVGIQYGLGQGQWVFSKRLGLVGVQYSVQV